MIISDSLKALLKQYLSDEEAAYTGLCSFVLWPNDGRPREAEIDELQDAFDYCGLDAYYPFNNGSSWAYVYEGDRDARRDNPERLLFIERALEDRLHEYLNN